MPSLQHRLLTVVIPWLRGSGEVVDPEQVRADVLAAQESADPAPPRRVTHRFDVSKRSFAEMPVFELSPRGTTPERTVLYVHGGGFVSGLDRFHWRYAARLADRLGVRVVLPAYPLAPRHTWPDIAPRLLALHEEVAAGSPEGVVLMGDSAGGGLALGLAQLVRDASAVPPTELVLISPWLDLAGTTPGTDEAAADDPWLVLSKLRLYGAWWAGDPPDPRTDPLSGDLDGLPRTLVLCGTRDVLVPQSRALAAHAHGAGWDLTYVEEPGLMHVYPILPVPEAGPAFAQVVDFLGG